jgi:hypothetical protein
MFTKNRNRSLKTWQKMEEIAKGIFMSLSVMISLLIIDTSFKTTITA